MRLRLKSAGTLMGIILIFLLAWVAIIGFVIRPHFWMGALLAILGGSTIGLVIAYLIRRWWLKPDLAQRMIKSLKEK